MNKIFTLLLFLLCCGRTMAQTLITGRVISADTRQPLPGANLRNIAQHLSAATGRNGEFSLRLSGDTATLTVTFLGYEPQRFLLRSRQPSGNLITLSPAAAALQAVVVSTGYQVLPRERATGSFTQVDTRTLNEQVSTDVLSRLEGVANSVSVDRTTAGSGGRLSVRGLSTIQGPKDPLVVVNNFIYDGDINNINPNDVESVTVLKDAAAASIWGARAGNGVIVITTKKGKFNQPIVIDFNANLSVAGKPNLNYIPQMSSADFISVEKYLYGQGYYTSQLTDPSRPPLTPVVELLAARDTGTLSAASADAQMAALAGHDIRDDFRKYVYQTSTRQQYALSLRGGTDKSAWLASTGYDRNVDNLDAKYSRVNLNFQDTYKPLKNLQLTAGLYYTQSQSTSGKPGYGSVTSRSGQYFYPYAQLADASGNPLPIVKDYEYQYAQSAASNGLLNWQYVPLEDYQHTVSTTRLTDAVINAGANYRLFSWLNADIRYQYERQSTNGQHLYDEDSYFARDLVNRFTQVNADGTLTRIIPPGGINDLSDALLASSQVRGQLNFSRDWGKSNVTAIGGGELRNAVTDSHSNRLYGYNAALSSFQNVDYTTPYPTYVSGDDTFIPSNTDIDRQHTRYVSVFANAAYTYNSRYSVSASARRDASNLFGVTTNRQWNPFYSAGASWLVSDESFYHSIRVPYLRLRATYGTSGNIDPSMVASTTILYNGSNFYTHTPQAIFSNYYNPDLRWETSKQLNLGLDFRLRGDRLSGSVEYYRKRGTDLFGVAVLDYTGGIGSQVIQNAASMKAHGLDLELHSLDLKGPVRWTTTLNLSFYHDAVTEYYLNSLQGSNFVSANGVVNISGIAGKPVYSIFAYRWAGLDPQTGDPQGYLNGQVSKDYNALTTTGTQAGDLKYFGSALPTSYGSFINNFSYHRLALDIGVTFKLGYYFRRNSINYTNLFENWQGHADFARRWQQPGDERTTNVPSMVYPEDNARDAFYSGSEVLVSRADHVRLQFVNLGYDLSGRWLKGSTIKALQLYVNASNLGILWRANHEHIDPDYYSSTYTLVPPKTWTIGIRSSF
ncbi:SusC/RagA family TonB-linked outer membrane protein [Mucilaginibacter robiniae]|uniref:SusC/RagA family TonB-linked outer membrane protein n=1 Tax=Mucilaginibacter robiniae TaxID=2728022 RepID=A0A7L5E6F7_9SPHI|nr:SusC/RagA family TonB-linked outer membrane protein [Mucilaginibacter robiniae]QJD95976.1 SusC/RagA family TonB-linked outer membrane protein [Mucilaginibacter robiniae]